MRGLFSPPGQIKIDVCGTGATWPELDGVRERVERSNGSPVTFETSSPRSMPAWAGMRTTCREALERPAAIMIEDSRNTRRPL